MLARTEDVIVQRQIRKEDQLIGDSPAARQQAAVVNVEVQPSPVAQALEEITTAKIAASDLQGWIYIGKADPSGALSDDRTISVARKPSPNADVTTIPSVDVRSQDTIRSGLSLGIIPRGAPSGAFPDGGGANAPGPGDSSATQQRDTAARRSSGCAASAPGGGG